MGAQPHCGWRRGEQSGATWAAGIAGGHCAAQHASCISPSAEGVRGVWSTPRSRGQDGGGRRLL
eukprot:8587174-Prorocentrum_lima.AAC.1